MRNLHAVIRNHNNGAIRSTHRYTPTRLGPKHHLNGPHLVCVCANGLSANQ